MSLQQALEACKDAGLVKSLGVSNFNRRQLELLLNKPGLKHKPVSNQVSRTSLASHLHWLRPQLQNLQFQNLPRLHACCAHRLLLSEQQVECHPYFTQPKLLEFCRKHDIVIVGYCPIGSSRDASW